MLLACFHVSCLFPLVFMVSCFHVSCCFGGCGNAWQLSHVLSVLTGLCQFGGTCVNTPGSFLCTCPPGVTGHRCQYRDTCTLTSCTSSNESCVLTVTNLSGFVCRDLNTDGRSQLLVVTATSGGAAGENEDVLGRLDDAVNTLQEMSLESGGRQRRQASTTPTTTPTSGDDDDDLQNGFVTVCEARFQPLPPAESGEGNTEAGLVWVCPPGVTAPPPGRLDDICLALFASGLVETCTSPSGLVVGGDPVPPQLPSTTYVSGWGQYIWGGASIYGARSL